MEGEGVKGAAQLVGGRLVAPVAANHPRLR
jgi:hypothetical protein